MPDFGDSRLPDVFWDKVSPEPNSGCWLWTGSTVGTDTVVGLLYRSRNQKTVTVHRYTYEALISPTERTLRRICTISECCNPLHYRQIPAKTKESERIRESERRARRKHDPEYQRAWRASALKYAYGISIEQFETMVLQQQGRCAICRVEFSQGKGRRRPCVDHDHGTGAIRGILCAKCNAGIGLLGDDPARLMAAASYVGKEAVHGE